MRSFTAHDGRAWTAEIHDGPLDQAHGIVGWEAIVFDADLQVQRLTFRPVGWLAEAADAQLRIALDESEAIRTRWQPAGG